MIVLLIKAVLTPEEAKSFYADVNAEIKRAKSFSKTFKYQFKNEELIEPSESDFKFFTEDIGFRPITDMAEQSTGFRGLEVEFNELFSEITNANNELQNLENKKEEYSDLSSKIKEIQDTRTLPIPRRKEKIEELKQEKKKFDAEYPSVKKDLIKTLKKTTQLNKIIKKNLDERIEGFTDYITESKEEIEEVDANKIRSLFAGEKEKVTVFTDEDVDSKETGKRLYPNSHTEIIGILSKIKGSQDIVRYLKDSSTSMLDETNPVNQGDKKTPRKMALAKLIMLFNKLEEGSLSKSDVKAIKKLKVLLDEPYEGTKIGSLKGYTKKYIKDVGDLEVRKSTLSNAKTLLGRLKKYEEQLVDKNKETDIFRLLGRTKKERRETLKYLRDLYKDSKQAKKYDIKGSGDTFAYVNKIPIKDPSSMDKETQDMVSNEYTSDYFGYETLMEYAESINALLIKRRDSIMTIQQKEELDRLEQETENLAETIEDQVQIGYGVNPQIEEDLETLEQSQEQIADDTSLLDLIRRSTPLMTTIINDSRTKGGMVMLTQEEEKKILKNMKNLANIVESYFKQDFDNQRSEEE